MLRTKTRKARNRKRRESRRRLIETLEPRRLLAVVASLNGSTASFTGDAAGETLELKANATNQLEFSTDGGTSFSTDLNPNQSGTQALTIDSSANITVNLGGGADQLKLGESLTVLLNIHSRSVTFDGGLGNDSLSGPDETAKWKLSGAGSGSIEVGSTPTDVVSFSNTESLVGAGQTDTLVGTNSAATWNLTSVGDGDYNVGGTKQVDFTDFESLIGGTAADQFKVVDAGRVGDFDFVKGTLDGGGGTDTLDYSGYDHEVVVNLAANASTVVADFANVESFVGGNKSATTYTAGTTAANAPLVRLQLGDRVQVGSGPAARIYVYQPVTPFPSGETDLVKLYPYDAATKTGFNFERDTTTWKLAAGNTIIGPDQINTWQVTGADAGSVGGFSFSDFGELLGGEQTDTFRFTGGGRVTGLVDGSGAATFDFVEESQTKEIKIGQRVLVNRAGVETIYERISSPISFHS